MFWTLYVFLFYFIAKIKLQKTSVWSVAIISSDRCSFIMFGASCKNVNREYISKIYIDNILFVFEPKPHLTQKTIFS